MKKDIHPQYFPNATTKCSCGAQFNIGATKEELSVETCSQCHPAYTGKKKIVDSTGRVERFKSLTQKAKEQQKTRKGIKSKEEKRKQKVEKQQKATA
jgi:large subunit ribosomal protein L31